MLSCLKSPALRGLRPFNASHPLSKLAFAQSFSSTPRYNVNALFTMTDNEELNGLLREIQDKIILPAYLPEKNRRIVFNPTKKQFLEQNPIDIEVEGYEHRFKAIDPHKDIPKTVNVTYAAINAMKTREDFENVGTLFAGLRKANQSLKGPVLLKAMRLMMQSGQVGALVGCLKQFKQTGMNLQSKEALVRLYTALAEQVAKAGGDVEKLEQLVRCSDTIQDVIQRPEHDEMISKLHISKAKKAQKMLDSATEEARKELEPIFSAHKNKDLRNSVFGRSLALYPRLALIKAKHEAGEDVDALMAKVNDEIEVVANLWHDRQPKDAETFDMDRVAETVQVTPILCPYGYFWTLRQHSALSTINYMSALGYTYRALKEAEKMSPNSAQRLTPVADRIPSHAAKVLQINQARRDGGVGPLPEVFGDITGVDLLAIKETLPPLENFNVKPRLGPVYRQAEELEEGAAAEEELQVEEEAQEQEAPTSTESKDSETKAS